MINISISESAIFTTLGNFLVSVLSAGSVVVKGQDNRVAEPLGTDYAVMWPIDRVRLATNTDTFSDVAFIGSITGTVLTVTQMLVGTIAVGQAVGASGMSVGTSITALGTGTGGIGTYTVNNSQNLASTTIQAGVELLGQPVQVTLQVDIHGPKSADNAHTVATMFRDQFGVDTFNTSNLVAHSLEPLYCNDPRQMPFMNAENQYEERWIVEVVIQVNPILSVPQQFAGSVNVGSIKSVGLYPV